MLRVEVGLTGYDLQFQKVTMSIQCKTFLDGPCMKWLSPNASASAHGWRKALAMLHTKKLPFHDDPKHSEELL